MQSLDTYKTLSTISQSLSSAGTPHGSAAAPSTGNLPPLTMSTQGSLKPAAVNLVMLTPELV